MISKQLSNRDDFIDNVAVNDDLDKLEINNESESGLSMVAVTRKLDVAPQVTALHSQLFQAQKRVAIALCGKGNIGSSWVELFAQQKAELEKRHNMNFEIVAVLDSQTYWFDEGGIEPLSIAERYADEAVANDGQTWINQLGAIQGFDVADL